jgi:replicative DNA helicase
VAKTAFLSNLTLDLLDSNKDLTGIFFSLDDNREVILNHLLSIKTGIPLNQVQRPQRMEKHKKILMEGYDYLTELALENRLFILDRSEIKNIDDLELEIKRRMNFKVFVAIDAFYNLGARHAGDDQDESLEKACRLKTLANSYQIPVICTGELVGSKTRISADAPPSIHDLNENGKFAYNANLILMLYPQNWKTYHKENDPLLTLKYEKNKLSYFRGTELLRFHRSTCRLEEFDEKLL